MQIAKVSRETNTSIDSLHGTGVAGQDAVGVWGSSLGPSRVIGLVSEAEPTKQAIAVEDLGRCWM